MTANDGVVDSSSAVATINVSDVPEVVNLSVSSTTGTEVGTTAITVTAEAGGAVTGGQTVSLAVTGTGITAGDYTLSNTTITIPNGATTGSVTFTIVDDTLLEGTETATLTISSPSSGLTLGSTTTQNVTISDNESATLNIATTSSVTEAGGAQAVGVVTLTITGTGSGTFALGTGISITADVTQAGGSATSGSDYTAFGTQTLTFNAGAATGATQNATLAVINDQLLEGSESVGLTLGNIGGSAVAKSLVQTSNTTTITDNEVGVIDFQADQSNSENVDPTIKAILTITPSGSSGQVALEQTLTVLASNLVTGTATITVDYATFAATTLTIAAGNANGSNQINSTTATLDVINDRQTKEGNETVNFGLSALPSTLNSTTSLADITHTATIVDNDSITVSGAATVNEASTYSLVVTVNLDPAPVTPTTMTINWGDTLTTVVNTPPLANGVTTYTHVYTDGLPTVRHVTVDLSETLGSYTDQANAHSLTVLNVAPTLDVNYGPVTYTGAQLQGLINTGVATAPSGTRVLTGTRLDFTEDVLGGVLLRLPLTPAGRMTNANSITFTLTADWDNLSADADLGFAITDGTQVVDGNFGQTDATNSKFWLEQGTDAGNRVDPVSYPNVASIARSMPFTVEVAVSPDGVTVRGTNNLGATFLYSSQVTATLNLPMR